MRSSDWSSDVCSSDLLYRNTERGVIFGVCAGLADYFGISRFFVRIVAVIALFMFPPPTLFCYFMAAFLIPRAPTYHYESDAEKERSEEHTSELQSLMRISYAVFCLKKKKRTIETNFELNDDTKKQVTLVK